MNIAIHASNGVSLHQFCVALIQELARKGHTVITIAKKDSFFPLLRAQHITTYDSHSIEDTVGITAAMRYLKRVHRILKQERIDLIHLMTPKAILFVTLLARTMGIKSVCVFTGLGYTFTLPWYHPIRIIAVLAFRVVLLAADRVIFLNNDDMHYFVSRRIVAQKKAHLIRSSGIDLVRHQRAHAGYPTPPCFIFIGRLMRIKGIVRFLEAACTLHMHAPAVHFIVVGSNEYGNRQMLSDDALAHYQSLLGTALECAGHVHDVRPYLQRSSVLVLPTQYREGVPQSILEAMAYALPIIASDVPGCREAVAHNKNGFLVPAMDSAALLRAMRYFVDAPTQIAQMGQCSRTMARTHFAVEIVNRKTIEVYRATGLMV